ncbi:hypothetical protein H9Q69_000979 [Fusarium xylarioides]|nr:hypothetical protein H9Q70_001833 [Fusarium xylarioides]KAG5784810.1 hypothetical protein H9Q73_001525 [Fusarium xylarioides]KAG5800011.1 hypothetical protein H9Q69_000979 [Fusarium xylarioides]KAG5802678.1 hypothetical protein H9Q71_012732 [Fusarium xylarioides]
MASEMKHQVIDEKIALLRENIQESFNSDLIRDILHDERPLKIYWGTATTGRPHCGYFVPAVKIAQFLSAGCEVTVLLADIHAFLDNSKAPIELVNHRVEYYRFVITAMLKACGVPVDQLRFVKGSDYQKSAEYSMDLFKLSSLVSEKQSKKAGAEVVKQTDNAPLSGLIYPLMQVLDEQYLDCDVQFGGIDQRKLFTAATEWLPKLGYRKRSHLMSPMVPGLNGNKMSSSDEDSKIDLLDAPDIVAKKVNKAHCVAGELEDNGLIALVLYVLMPLSKMKTGTPTFTVEGDTAMLKHYTNIDDVRDDYKTHVLTPKMLKVAVAKGLNEIMEPIRAEFAASNEWQEVTLKAYPPPVKKEKKVKNLGTRFPGAKSGESSKDSEMKDIEKDTEKDTEKNADEHS